MVLHFIGTGSAFSIKKYQTNTLVAKNGKFLLIDAGGDIKRSLNAAKKSYMDIDAVYVSHLHADHVGGIEYLAFSSFFDPKYKNKFNGSMKFYGESNLIKDAWEKSLRGGLEKISDRYMTLKDYFDVNPIEQDGGFTWEGLNFTLAPTDHIIVDNDNTKSYGLLITDPEYNKTIYYTSDSTYDPKSLQKYYDVSDYIIQDCETYPFKSGVHPNYDDLRLLSADVKSKMFLQHYNDNILDEGGEILEEWESKAKADGFWGFIHQGSEGIIEG